MGYPDENDPRKPLLDKTGADHSRREAREAVPGRYTEYIDNEDTEQIPGDNRRLADREERVPASCPPYEACDHTAIDDKARRAAGASSLPDSRPPPIHTHPNSSPEEVIPNGHNENQTRILENGQQVIIVRRGGLSPLVVCPWCHRQGPTIQYKKNGFCTWFAAFLTCATGLWCLCPFTLCIDSFKDSVHYCSHCRRYLGRTLA